MYSYAAPVSVQLPVWRTDVLSLASHNSLFPTDCVINMSQKMQCDIVCNTGMPTRSPQAGSSAFCDPLMQSDKMFCDDCRLHTSCCYSNLVVGEERRGDWSCLFGGLTKAAISHGAYIFFAIVLLYGQCGSI